MTICSHAGQGCAITSRLLVPRSQHDEIVAKVAQHLEGVKVGDPSDPEVYMGPLISEAQREKVHGMVERAVAAGRSEEHTSELQSLMRISYAVFCLKKKKKQKY